MYAQHLQALLLVAVVLLPFMSKMGTNNFKPGLLASFAVGAIGWLVLLPAVERDDIYQAIAAEGPEGRFAAEVFRECRSPGLFQHNPVAQCKQMVVDLAGKQYDKSFADKATTAVQQLADRLKATS